MSTIEAYIKNVQSTLDTVLATQAEAMERAAAVLADAIAGGHAVFAFGTNHAGILAQELFYRTGGLVVVNCIRAPGVSLDVDPPTLTTYMERIPGYGRSIIDATPLAAGDVLILHSVSGRNAVPIDAALRAKEIGAHTICLTNMNTTTKVEARHPGGKNLYAVCDIALDNCGAYGDASLKLEGLSERVAPTSTAVGAAVLNAVVARCIELLIEKGVEPPVFISSNVPEGDGHNERMMEQYKNQVFYMPARR